METASVHQEVVYAKTLDGWDLKLFHYLPRKDQISNYPVVLCHGLLANKNSCDFGEMGTPEWRQYSLAAFLLEETQDGGPVFDVWVPELRGCGCPTLDPGKHPERYRWDLDDFVDYDVPAIIGRVQQWYTERKRPAPPVFWVGKSMGGMIAYAYGETPAGQRNLKGVVTLGSPVVFGKSNVLLEFLTRVSPRRVSLPLRIREIVARSAEVSNHFKGLGINPSNIDPEVFRMYLKVGLCETYSSKVLSQFSIFIKHSNFCRYPRYPWMYDLFGRIPGIKHLVAPYSYKDHLREFVTPLLAIAGGHDKLGPTQDVRYAVEHVGSSDVTYLEFSKEAGYRDDYGHLDLNLGLHAREDVYPAVQAWLRKRSDVQRPRDDGARKKGEKREI
ncbi:MAG TPA: alpha/beta fold hydrolase [Candidatus Thermoplasmatota archaeon]|nr:alpha/beta fold hydrolase [Candidatus Thermoplasmatota archaeon]